MERPSRLILIVFDRFMTKGCVDKGFYKNFGNFRNKDKIIGKYKLIGASSI
jgi:hypothetical protein